MEEIFFIKIPTPCPSPLSLNPLKQPNPSKNEEHGQGEGEPGSPANTRAALGHAEHAVHGPSQAGARVVEAVVHIGGECGRGGDLGGDGEGDLFFRRSWRGG